MSIAKQLFQLQELDLEIESTEQSIKQITGQLGESEAVVAARNKLGAENQRLEELNRTQKSTEYDIQDLTTKLNKATEELYSGRIHNPKELTTLQQEIESIKTRKSQLEDKTLGLMEQTEQAKSNVGSFSSELKLKETEWRSQQKALSTQLEELKTRLAALKQERGQTTSEIEHSTLQMYNDLRKQKGIAVVKVEQGICRGCRISLPVSELQRIRGGSLVRCSSCGRILFLA
jgi:predicted  nucleic acid-binding Zn-ribbon protein